MTDYMRWLDRERGLRFDDYAALWRWSVDDLEGFWTSVATTTTSRCVATAAAS